MHFPWPRDQEVQTRCLLELFFSRVYNTDMIQKRAPEFIDGLADQLIFPLPRYRR